MDLGCGVGENSTGIDAADEEMALHEEATRLFLDIQDAISTTSLVISRGAACDVLSMV